MKNTRLPKTEQPREFTFRERLLTMSIHERTLQLAEFIRSKIAQTLNLAESEVALDAPFATLHAEWENIGLVHQVLKDLIEGKLERRFYYWELLPYPRENGPRNTIEQLATYLAEDIEIPPPETTFTDPHEGGNWAWGLPGPRPAGAERNPSMVFLLSAARAGSTLLRIMLAGHPNLFSPQELYLLPFETMAERKRKLEQHGYFWMLRGLHAAVAHLEQLTLEQAQQSVSQLEADDVPIQRMYQLLQHLIGDRLLVDKTPPYSIHPAWLRRAEELFDGAKYLHLVRHPYAVIESIMRVRFHGRLIGNHWGCWDENPWLFAEKWWAITYHNTLQFLKDVHQQRQHLVYFEDLVTNPQSVMTGICDFLCIPFDAAVLEPYQGERMSGGIGDPNFLTRNRINPTLATAWKNKRPPQRLSEFTQRVATEFGYELQD